MSKGGKSTGRGSLVEVTGSRQFAEPERRLREGLKLCSLFSRLDDKTLAHVVRGSSLSRFVRRRLVYGQEERPTAVYIVTRGRVRVVRSTGDDRALTVAYLGAGDLIGETAFLGGDSYHDSATATEDGEAIRIPIARMRELLGHSTFATAMLRLMLERRLEAERRIDSLLSRSVESRVAEFLLDAAERHGIPEASGVLIAVRYTHQEIADYVGSTRETVTLTLGELRRREVIAFDHRRLVLLDSRSLHGLR